MLCCKATGQGGGFPLVQGGGIWGARRGNAGVQRTCHRLHGKGGREAGSKVTPPAGRASSAPGIVGPVPSRKVFVAGGPRSKCRDSWLLLEFPHRNATALAGEAGGVQENETRECFQEEESAVVGPQCIRMH